MKKKDLIKKMLLTAAMLSSVCLLGGCGNNSANAEVMYQQEPPKETQQATQTADQEKPEADKADTKADNEVAICYDALNEFSYRLFAENMAEENPVLSPVSAYMALSMAGLGAENHTKEEFTSVFGDDTDMAALYNHIMTTYPASTQSNTIALANSAWISENYSVSGQWLSDIETIMHSEVFQKDLTSPAIVDDMNTWISEKTNKMIDKMVDKPLKDSTGLVLFNTVYFKAKWEEPFESYSVYPDKFFAEDGMESKNVDMMHKESEMEYFSNEFAQGLLFPYRYEEGGAEYAFVAIKPVDESTKIRDLYRELTPPVINGLLEDRQTETVNTKLPKFEIEFDRQLNESLMAMGLNDAFDMEKADFGGIDAGVLTGADNKDALNQHNLYIDLVRQKAKIIVDEEGTEAAAATQVIMECGAAITEEAPKEVFFDRPFVYMIMNMEDEVPLFIGILDSPKQS